MGWIYSQELPDLPSLSDLGCDRSLIVKAISTAKVSLCHSCGATGLIGHQSVTTCGRCGVRISQSRSTSFTVVSLARTSALQDMAKVWKESEAGFFSRSCGSSQKCIPLLSSSKTSRLSEHVERNVWGKNWPAEGMIVAGELFPLLKSEPVTKEKDGSYWPTPTQKDHGWIKISKIPTPTATRYGTNRGGGAGRVGNFRISIHRMASFGILPSHPKGSLNREYLEQVMGYPTQWTEIDAWVMPWFLSKRGKRSKG